MANVEVSFDRIDVDDDGDPGLTDGGGDFYWSLNVNGARIGHRSVSNMLTVGNGGVSTSARRPRSSSSPTRT